MLEMNEFWGFAAAPYVAIIGITVISIICLVTARLFVTKI
ncbi:hypothetical protein SAMN05444673_6694 [Bacillus sp. OV166]|jgi:hypothetical protein|nr:hypothetical protein SAMN05444673_6694 [Bacillus sp. OV166]